MLNELNGKNIIVTGGYGFIGNHLLKLLLQTTANVIVVDKLTYASTFPYGKVVNDHQFYCVDIANQYFTEVINNLLKNNLINSKKVDYVLHLAAESHVDNSIKNPNIFASTNIIGTVNILNFVKHIGCRLVHVSTDEVYGHFTEKTGAFTETNSLLPRSPYSASKACSDLLVKSYINTYGIDACITRCCNNFGIYQHHEKFIPTCVKSVVTNKPIPIYGDGKNIREWIHAKDHALGILKVACKGKSGEIYNIGTGYEYSNIEIAQKIINIGNSKGYNGTIQYVKDRPGHDFRYAVDNTKYINEFGKDKLTTLDETLDEIFEFYKAKI